MGFLHDDLIGGKSLNVDGYEKYNFEAMAEVMEEARQNTL